MKRKITLEQYDPFVIKVRSAEETTEMFGEDYLQDYGLEVSPELVERFKKNWQEFWAIQEELSALKKQQDQR